MDAALGSLPWRCDRGHHVARNVVGCFGDFLKWQSFWGVRGFVETFGTQWDCLERSCKSTSLTRRSLIEEYALAAGWVLLPFMTRNFECRKCAQTCGWTCFRRGERIKRHKIHFWFWRSAELAAVLSNWVCCPLKVARVLLCILGGRGKCQKYWEHATQVWVSVGRVFKQSLNWAKMSNDFETFFFIHIKYAIGLLGPVLLDQSCRRSSWGC